MHQLQWDDDRCSDRVACLVMIVTPGHSDVKYVVKKHERIGCGKCRVILVEGLHVIVGIMGWGLIT